MAGFGGGSRSDVAATAGPAWFLSPAPHAVLRASGPVRSGPVRTAAATREETTTRPRPPVNAGACLVSSATSAPAAGPAVCCARENDGELGTLLLADGTALDFTTCSGCGTTACWRGTRSTPVKNGHVIRGFGGYVRPCLVLKNFTKQIP